MPDPERKYWAEPGEATAFLNQYLDSVITPEAQEIHEKLLDDHDYKWDLMKALTEEITDQAMPDLIEKAINMINNVVPNIYVPRSEKRIKWFFRREREDLDETKMVKWGSDDRQSDYRLGVESWLKHFERQYKSG